MGGWPRCPEGEVDVDGLVTQFEGDTEMARASFAGANATGSRAGQTVALAVQSELAAQWIGRITVKNHDSSAAELQVSKT